MSDAVTEGLEEGQDPSNAVDPEDPSVVWIAGRADCKAPRCAALLSDKSRRCRNPSSPGGSVCGYHGARAPQVKRSNERRLVQKRAAEKLSDWGYEPVTDPLQTMSDLAGRAVALVDAIGSELADGRVTVAAVEALGAALERAHRQAKDLASVGFEEHRLRLEQAKLAMAVALVRNVLGRAGLNPDSPEVRTWISAAAAEIETAESAS